MDKVVPSPTSPVSSPQPAQRRLGSGALVTLVNGGLAGVGGVYASTHSVMITIIAAVVAITLAAMVLIFQR